MRLSNKRMMSAFGPKQTSASAPHMSAFGGKADIAFASQNYEVSSSAEPYSSNCDLGSNAWAKTSLLQAGVYVEACDINVKATSGRRTTAIAKIADDALAASTSLFGLTLTASKSLLEAQEGLRSKPTAAIP